MFIPINHRAHETTVGNVSASWWTPTPPKRTNGASTTATAATWCTRPTTAKLRSPWPGSTHPKAGFSSAKKGRLPTWAAALFMIGLRSWFTRMEGTSTPTWASGSPWRHSLSGRSTSRGNGLVNLKGSGAAGNSCSYYSYSCWW
jgi:hypothetical protein